ncbi:MAG: LPD7 domain-containing protein [Variovorax sp.]
MATAMTSHEDPDTAAAGSVTKHPPQPTPDGHAANRRVPDGVARRFLRIDDRYFFPDRTLAFIDTGDRLKVRSHNLEVVHSIVAIMQARGWCAVQLKGTPEFRQKVWHEATLQGIGVRGYAPSDIDMQKLQQALDRNRTHQHSSRIEELDRATTTGATAQSDNRRPARNGLRPPSTGVLLAHAAAPYQFDPTQGMSYYVRVQTEVGERTLWGTDLERAVAESRSGVRVGDQIVLSQRGAHPVAVRVPERNVDGELVGTRKVVGQRMTWTAEKVDYVEALELKAAALRSDALTASTVLTRYPDLGGAVAALKLAEQFAQRLTPQLTDQMRVVQAIRTGLADAVAQGLQVRLPSRQKPQERPDRTHARARTRSTPDDPGIARA